MLEVAVDAEGHVTGADVLTVDREGAPAAPFVAAARDHVARLWLHPATDGSAPRPAIVGLEIAFDPPPAAPAETEAPTAAQPVARAAPAAPPDPEVSPRALAFGAEAVIDADPRELDLAASAFTLQSGPLSDVPRRRGADLLTLAPGVVLQNHSGEGHAPTLYLRGFDAGEGQDFAIDVEGVPLNEPSNAHGHGYADLYFVIPEVVKRVRVLEGPFDPSQGDFAVAGSASYELAPPPGITAAIGLGSFGEQRLMASVAPRQVEAGTFAAVDVRRGDGFGPNRAHASVSALGQWRLRRGPLTVSILAGTSALEMDAVGVVRADALASGSLPCGPEYRSQFFCYHDPQQGGSGSRHLASVRLDHRRSGRLFSQQLFATLRKLRMRENFTGALLDPRGDGLDEHTTSTTVGGRGRYRRRWRWRGRGQRAEIGYLARHDVGRTRQWRLRADGGQPYARVFDTSFRITNVGVWVATHLEPFPRLWVDLGLRGDAFAFQLIDHDRPTTDRMGPRLSEEATDAFGLVLQPRGTVGVRLARGLDLLVAAGRGVRSSDARALSEGESAPFADVFASEVGLVFRRRRGRWSADVRAIGFYTYVSDDRVFDPERGRNVPVGSSQRYGGTLSGRLRGPWLEVAVASTVSEALRGGGVFDLGREERLPFVPRTVSRVDAATRRSWTLGGERFRWGLAVGAGLVGPKPLPLGERSESIVSLDASAQVSWRWVSLRVSVENLLDARNRAAEFNYPSDFTGPGETPSLRAARHVAAGPPRTVFATLSFTFDAPEGGDGPPSSSDPETSEAPDDPAL